VPLVPELLWARVPALYFGMADFYAALDRRRSPLDPALRSNVQTRISQVDHCEFRIDLTAAIAAERAGSMEMALTVAE
jgi:alkylhydroperoxidase family enzyme